MGTESLEGGIQRLEGKETLVSTSEQDKGKWLEFEGKKYYVVKDNDDFRKKICEGEGIIYLFHV